MSPTGYCGKKYGSHKRKNAMKIGPLGMVKMQGLFMLFGAVLACPCTSSAADVRFFRIVGPTATVITALNEDGTVTWTNDVVGVTCTVESAYSTGDDATWDRYTELVVTSSVARLRIFDPNSPVRMAYIPPGSNRGTDPGVGSQPYLLTAGAFYMDRTEVTKEQWDEVYIWALAQEYGFDNAGSGKAANHPVQSVNWYDCVKWCNARSEKEGRPACYRVGGMIYRSGTNDAVICDMNAGGYRLPTPDEWEYAARGGASSQRFPWGDTIDHSLANYNGFWMDGAPFSDYDQGYQGYDTRYNDGVLPYTAPAGSFAANGYGLYDTAGNVAELCFDWYPGREGESRIQTGGSWYAFTYNCESAGHGSVTPSLELDDIGFRTVLPAGQ